MKKLHINLHQEIAERISTREAIRNVFNKDYSDVNKVLIDFIHIDFIGRSPVHEIVKQTDKLKKRSIKIEMVNMIDDVKKMFDIVNESIKNPIDRSVKLEVFTYQTEDEFYEFIGSL